MKARQFQTVFSFVLASALGVATMAVSEPPTAQAQNLSGTIRSVVAGKCIQPVDSSTVEGAAIVQEPCDSTAVPAQLWTIIPWKGYFHYVNQATGMCLDARGGAQNHTPVEQWPCNSISNEHWVYTPAKPGDQSVVVVYSAVAGSSGKFCLDVPGGQKTDGLALQIYTCNGTKSQQWF